MASIVTRSKPNCFNALFQLQRRMVQGQPLQEILGNYAGVKSSRLSILGMSPAESAAVVNLVHHLPTEATRLLEHSARQHGMFKGAFMASHELRVGFEPSVIGPEWKTLLRNDNESVTLAVKRVLENFNSAPEGLRKAAGPQEASRTAPIARAWLLAKSQIASKLPEALYRAASTSGLASWWKSAPQR